jgi:hypothetical protein
MPKLFTDRFEVPPVSFWCKKYPSSSTRRVIGKTEPAVSSVRLTLSYLLS